MATAKVRSLPKDFACVRVQAGRSVTAEMDINTARFDNRGRGGIGIDIIPQWLGVIAVKELLVELDLAGLRINADPKIIMAVNRRGCQPDLRPENRRRRPPAIWYGRLPFDVLRFRPLKRDSAKISIAAGANMAVPKRSSEFRPIRFNRNVERPKNGC